MDVGFHFAGFETILANDHDPIACQSFRVNHGDVIIGGDVKAILPLTSHLKDIDLVFGGPPCQGFSVAGKMDPDDHRNELIASFFQIVGKIKPRAFVCENVKALAVLTRWKEVKEALMKEAKDLGYEIALLLLNSSDYGVPQARERMFLIGFRRDEFGEQKYLEAVLRTLLNDTKHSPPTIRDVITSLGKAGSKSNNRICNAKITYAKVPVLRRSPYAGMLFNGAGRPLPAEGFSSTLPASMGGNKTPIVDEDEIFKKSPSFIEIYHSHLMVDGKPRTGAVPRNLRRLTLDECLAIQTFPKGYKLAGSQSAAFRQIGNAVPCKLAEAVALVVAYILENKISKPLLEKSLANMELDPQRKMFQCQSEYA